jgi:hypothetical protein
MLIAIMTSAAGVLCPRAEKYKSDTFLNLVARRTKKRFSEDIISLLKPLLIYISANCIGLEMSFMEFLLGQRHPTSLEIGSPDNMFTGFLFQYDT